jgi:hypothetical protein
VAVLENKRSTGWQFSITRGAQGGNSRSQGEHRVAVLDQGDTLQEEHRVVVLHHIRITGW